MVARMVWSKGVREFVEAAKLLQAQHADTKFLLVGDVEPGSPLAISNEYLTRGVSDNVIWLGFRRDARELTALSDVVVLPSYYREGVPLTLLEGMSLGKPVVTTDSVGCREVVEEGRNGYLVPTRDPHALAEAIGRLLNDPVLRAEMGASGRSWVEREFNEKLIVARVIKELYRLENSQ